MNNNVITTGSFSNGIWGDNHRCLLYPMNFGCTTDFDKTRLSGGNYLFLFYFSQKLSPKFLVCLSTCPCGSVFLSLTCSHL
jgi:hypothetical protein